MLRFIINVLIFLFILRLTAPLVGRAGRALKRLFSSPPVRPGPTQGKKRGEYSDLTPYEIEDADYEEIRNERDRAS